MPRPQDRSADSPTEPLRPVLRPALTREQAEETAQMLSVVSSAVRLQILSLIHNNVERRCRVVDLTKVLELRQPTVSHHLKVMVEAGILAREPVGREVWYEIVPHRLGTIADLLR